MMTLDQIEQVFGRGRLKMATGKHVEVFREAMAPGERRRYTKRFLATSDGDFGPWTEREWRILARLIGHGIRSVPDVVQFDGGAMGGARLVQTYDAGITVDQWSTLLPIARNGETQRHVFEDCAHWWALAQHCLAALDEIHALGLVHLDIKGDNICIPYGPADFDPDAPANRLRPEFGRLALIDFAFSLVSRESLAMPLPIGWQKDYDYQSPRLLRALDAGRNGDLEPTKELDWRCDLYSLAAMLKRYLPADGRAHEDARETGWTAQRYDDARTLIFRLRDSHDRDLPHWRPHLQFMDYTSARLDARDLAASLAEGWTLARDTVTAGIATPMTPITPMTRIAPVISTVRSARTVMQPAPSMVIGEATWSSAPIAAAPPRHAALPPAAPTVITAVIRSGRAPPPRLEPQRAPTRATRRLPRRALPVSIALASLAAIAAPSFVGDPQHPLADRAREVMAALRLPFDWPTQDVVRPPNTSPPVAPSTREPDPDAQFADRSSSEPERGTASATPTPPERMVAAAPPTDAEPLAAAPHSDPEGATATTKPVEEPAVPPRNDAREPSNSANARVVTAPPAPDAAGAKVVQAHPKPDIAASRAQPVKRSSTAPAKLANGPAKTYADAARRPTVYVSSAVRARVAAPPSRVDLASVTSTPSGPPSVTPPTPKTTESSNESAAHHAAPPTAGASASSEIESKDATAEGSRSNAAAKPTGSSEPSVSRAEPSPARSAPRAKSRDDWRTQLAGLFGLLRDRTGSPAPVEDRAAHASGNRQAAASRTLAQSATDARARAAPVPSAAASTPPSQSVVPSSAVPVPLVIEPVIQAPPAPAPMSSQDADVRTQARNVADPAASTASTPLPFPLGMRHIPAPTAPSPTRTVAAPRRYPIDEAQDLAASARRLLANTVPRVATQAEPEVSRVLSTAAIAMHPAQARLVIDAADGPWPSESAWIPVAEATPAYARGLHNEARRVLASGGDISEAVNIELQAFAANPRDPDIAGYLALLHLRMNPARPEVARQLALHSIVLSGSRRSTRHAEWSTFAVASALTGRDADAVRAFLAEAALTTNVDRSCQAALRAYASYGERLRAPVLALLQRVNAQGRAYDAPSCMWPAYWNNAARAASSY